MMQVNSQFEGLGGYPEQEEGDVALQANRTAQFGQEKMEVAQRSARGGGLPVGAGIGQRQSQHIVIQFGNGGQPGDGPMNAFDHGGQQQVADLQQNNFVGTPAALHQESLAQHPAYFSQTSSLVHEMAKPQTNLQSLKSRMRKTMNSQKQGKPKHEEREELTKHELKQLKKMNRNREMYTLLDRTKANNHLKYLRNPRIQSAVGGSHQFRRKTNSSSRQSSRLGSAHSRSSNSASKQGLPYQQGFPRKLMSANSKTLSNYNTMISSGNLKNNKLQQNLDRIMKKPVKQPKGLGHSELNFTVEESHKNEFSSGDEDRGLQTASNNFMKGSLRSNDERRQREVGSDMKSSQLPQLHQQNMYPSVNQLLYENPDAAQKEGALSKNTLRKRIMSAQTSKTRICKRPLKSAKLSAISKKSTVRQGNANSKLPRVPPPGVLNQQMGALASAHNSQIAGHGSSLSPVQAQQNPFARTSATNTLEQNEESALLILKQYSGITGQLYSHHGGTQTTKAQPSLTATQGANSQHSTALSKSNAKRQVPVSNKRIIIKDGQASLHQESGQPSSTVDQRTVLESGIPRLQSSMVQQDSIQFGGNIIHTEGKSNNFDLSTLTHHDKEELGKDQRGQPQKKSLIEAGVDQQPVLPAVSRNQEILEMRHFSHTQDPKTEDFDKLQTVTSESDNSNTAALLNTGAQSTTHAQPAPKPPLVSVPPIKIEGNERRSTDGNQQLTSHFAGEQSQKDIPRLHQFTAGSQSTVNAQALHMQIGGSGLQPNRNALKSAIVRMAGPRSLPQEQSQPARAAPKSTQGAGVPSTNFQHLTQLYAAGSKQNLGQMRVSPLKAPQFKIQSLKHDIDSVQKRSQNLRKEIERFDGNFTKLQKETKKLKEKTLQCQVDKVEIMRDLATFEYNFCNNLYDGLNFRERIHNMIAEVQRGKAECTRRVKFKDEEAYFTDSSYSQRFLEEEGLLPSSMFEPAHDESQEKGLAGLSQPSLAPRSAARRMEAVDEDSQEQRTTSPGEQQLRQVSSPDADPSEQQEPAAQRCDNREWLRDVELQNLKQTINQLQQLKKFRITTSQGVFQFCQNEQAADPQKGPGSGRQPSAAEPAGDAGGAARGDASGDLAKKGTMLPHSVSFRRGGHASLNKSYNPLNDMCIDPSDIVLPQNQLVGNRNLDKDLFLNAVMSISGLTCIIHCSFMNGLILGYVSVGTTCKNFKFEMVPVNNYRLQSVNLMRELARLALDLKFSDSGKPQLYLKIKDSHSEKEKNSLIRLQGSSSKVNSIQLEYDRAGQRIDFRTQMPVFHNHRGLENFAPCMLPISGSLDAWKFEMDLGEGRAWEEAMHDVARQIQKTMCFIQNSNADYTMMDKQEAQNFHRNEIETLYKSKHISLNTKGTKSSVPMKPQFFNKGDSRYSQNQRSATPDRQVPVEQAGAAQAILALNLRSHNKSQDTTIAHILKEIQSSPTQSKGENSAANQSSNVRKASREHSLEQPEGDEALNAKPSRNHSHMLLASSSLDLAQEPEMVSNSFDNIKESQRRKTTRQSRKAEEETTADEALILQLQELRLLDQAPEAMHEDDLELELFEPLYGMRLAKSKKKFIKIKQQKQKKIAQDNERREQENEIIRKYFQEITQELHVTQTRSTAHQKPRRKYFRQPKIYQNKYIKRIQDQKKQIDLKTYKDTTDENFNVLCLFFQQKNEIYLLLGREEIHKNDQNSEVSGTSSQLQQINEKDDDSPYFVQINIDQIFLSYLDEPNLFKPQDILGPPNQCQAMVDDKVFKEIVRKEICNMFYQRVQQEKSESPGSELNLKEEQVEPSAQDLHQPLKPLKPAVNEEEENSLHSKRTPTLQSALNSQQQHLRQSSHERRESQIIEEVERISSSQKTSQESGTLHSPHTADKNDSAKKHSYARHGLTPEQEQLRRGQSFISPHNAGLNFPTPLHAQKQWTDSQRDLGQGRRPSRALSKADVLSRNVGLERIPSVAEERTLKDELSPAAGSQRSAPSSELNPYEEELNELFPCYSIVLNMQQ